jgi:hypothetical protein
MILFSPTLKAGKSARLASLYTVLGLQFSQFGPAASRTLNNRFVTLLTPVDFVDL